MDEDDHRTGGLVDDLLDQHERVIAALAQPDKRNIRSFLRGHGADIFDLDLALSLRAPGCNDWRDQRQAILALVRDQHAQMLCLPVAPGSRTPSLARLAPPPRPAVDAAGLIGVM
jgi:hypothetical protein